MRTIHPVTLNYQFLMFHSQHVIEVIHHAVMQQVWRKEQTFDSEERMATATAVTVEAVTVAVAVGVAVVAVGMVADIVVDAVVAVDC